MTPVEERIDHAEAKRIAEQLRQLKEKYRDDGLERLARSNPDYHNSHGSYLPELAILLLAERAEMRALLTEHSAREEVLVKRVREDERWPVDVQALVLEILADALPATESAQSEEEDAAEPPYPDHLGTV